MAKDVPTIELNTTFKRRNRRDLGPESTIINYKSTIPDPESAIQAERFDVPLRIVKPNPESLVNYEQEFILDRGETHTVGGGHVRDPSNGAKTPPPATELDRDRYRMAEFPFYEGMVTLLGSHIVNFG